MSGEWGRVSRATPCPICEKPDWCTVALDGTAACCMRIESGVAAKNGGWVHRLGPAAPLPWRRRPYIPLRPAAPRIDAAAVWRAFRHDAAIDATGDAALALGLPPWTVWELGAGIDDQGNLAFPMYDGALNIIGIRLRSPDGRKWAVTGSKAGVFVPWRYRPHDWDNRGHAIVVEGPTDASAVLSLDMIPIGRPSALGCEQTVADAAHAIGATSLTIVADVDNNKIGEMGARRLSATLTTASIRHRLVTAGGHKDFRKWVQAGVDRPTVEMQWANARWM